jgi:hypothetical protein
MARRRRTGTVTMSFGSLKPFGHVAALLGALALLGFTSVASADTFDVPVKKKVVDFGLSSANPPGRQDFRVELSCWSYPNFMVKEYNDEGEKGAQWLAILSIRQGTTLACTRAHGAAERMIQWPDWSGYFEGVKGNLVFFNGADGTDGGLPFIIYDYQTGKRIFEDSRMLGRTADDSSSSRLQFSRSEDGRLFLTYLRVVEVDCDLHARKAPCWERVRKKLGLKGDQPPVCIDYDGISGRLVSAVAYPVEVSLSPRPTRKAVAGPVKCWPVD